jgi:hypothetical protein
VADGQEVPDAWHHQMIYGVSPKGWILKRLACIIHMPSIAGVYLTNPQQLVKASVFTRQLCSDSILLVRRKDVLSRCNPCTNLSVLAGVSDARWHRLNVLGRSCLRFLFLLIFLLLLRSSCERAARGGRMFCFLSWSHHFTHLHPGGVPVGHQPLYAVLLPFPA